MFSRWSRWFVAGVVLGGMVGLTALQADDQTSPPKRPTLLPPRGSEAAPPRSGSSNTGGGANESPRMISPRTNVGGGNPSSPADSLRTQGNRVNPRGDSGTPAPRLPNLPNFPQNSASGKSDSPTRPTLPPRTQPSTGSSGAGGRPNLVPNNPGGNLRNNPGGNPGGMSPNPGTTSPPNLGNIVPGNRPGGSSNPGSFGNRGLGSGLLPPTNQGTVGDQTPRDRGGRPQGTFRGQSDQLDGSTKGLGTNPADRGSKTESPRGALSGALSKGTATTRPRDVTRPGDSLPRIDLDPKVKERLDRAAKGLGQDIRPQDGAPLGDRRPPGAGQRLTDPNVKGPLNPDLGPGRTDRPDFPRLGTERLGADRLGPARLDTNRKVIQTRFDKNGLLGDPRIEDELTRLKRVRDPQEVQNFFTRVKESPEFRNTRLANIDVNHLAGNFDRNFQAGQFNRLTQTTLATNIHLGDQYNLFIQGGDVARQLNLHQTLVTRGGWPNRYVGPVYVNYTQFAFSAWYPGPAFYPRYCWTPLWRPWVGWCFWDYCWPIYDPRPWICRPIVCVPCPPIVVYDYPVFTPLPVVACGTWVDYQPVIVDSGFDLQLVAVRFVDPGHPDQDLGPRYRVWIANNSATAVGAPFHVTLVAANSPTLQGGDLIQAGVTVPSLDARETVPVDIRLPAAANRLGSTPDGYRIPFSHLHVIVDSHRDLAEVNEQNNGAVIARGDILPVDPAAFATDVTAAAPGTMVSLAGEGFGPEPGQLIVVVDGIQQQAEIHGWYDLGVHFKLPGLKLAGPTVADILVVRGDGAASNPVTITLAPNQFLAEAPLPPLPTP